MSGVTAPELCACARGLQVTGAAASCSSRGCARGVHCAVHGGRGVRSGIRPATSSSAGQALPTSSWGVCDYGMGASPMAPAFAGPAGDFVFFFSKDHLLVTMTCGKNALARQGRVTERDGALMADHRSAAMTRRCWSSSLGVNGQWPLLSAALC